MNHFPFHVGDWVTATAHLSEVEECIYLRLICSYYSREACLPSDVRAVCRLVRASTPAARKATETVLGEFFTLGADGWTHKRCDAELARFHERSDSARKSVQARWDKRNTDAIRTYPERNTSQKPVTSNQEPEPVGKARAARKRAPATLLAAGWSVPVEWLAWAEQERREWSDADLHRCAAVFVDYWRSKGEARSDWEATWRNWVRRERGTAPAAVSRLTPVGQRSAQALERWIDESEALNGTHGP